MAILPSGSDLGSREPIGGTTVGAAAPPGSPAGPHPPRAPRGRVARRGADPGPAGRGVQHGEQSRVGNHQLLGVDDQPEDADRRPAAAPTPGSSPPDARSKAAPHLIPESELDARSETGSARSRSNCSACSQRAGRGPAQHLHLRRWPGNRHLPGGARDARGPLADDRDPNFTKLQQYGDLDALIEIYGHLRAANPTLDVFHRFATEVEADDLSTHVIVLGGIAWNQVDPAVPDGHQPGARSPRSVDPKLETGEIFEVRRSEDDTSGSTRVGRRRSRRRTASSSRTWRSSPGFPTRSRAAGP